MVKALCKGYFPLHLKFQCLEERPIGDVVFVDFESTKELKVDALGAICHFLADEDCRRKGIAGKVHRGFTFVEAVYTVFRNSMIECQPLRMDILMSLFSSLIEHVNEALDHIQSSDHNMETGDIAKNNLRLCTFFLGHILCIMEEVWFSPENLEDKVQKSKSFNSKDVELRASALSVLCNVSRKTEQAVFSLQDIRAAKELINSAALSCLINLKSGKGAAEDLQKIVFSILSDTFTGKAGREFEIPQKRFISLMCLCIKHKHLIPTMADFIENLLIIEEVSGLSFLGQVVKYITEKAASTVSSEKRGSLQDEIEIGMLLLAEFASRYDAVVLIGLHLGSLVHIVKNERAAIRKCFSVIVGSCLKRFDLISSVDQQILAQVYEVLSRDKDATCRLRIITLLGNSLNWLHCSNSSTITMLLSLLSKRTLDKSKMVRLKAIQLLEVLFKEERVLSVSEDSPLSSITPAVSDIIFNVAKLLVISPDSTCFCKDTIRAVSCLLCSRYLKGSLLFDLLDRLLRFSLTSSNVIEIFKIFDFHLDEYAAWLEFLSGRTEDWMTKLEGFLSLANDCLKFENSRYLLLIEDTFTALAHYDAIQTDNAKTVLASCTLLAIFLPLRCFKLTSVKEKGHCLVRILVMTTENSTDASVSGMKTQISRRAFKALSVLLEFKSKTLHKEVKKFIEENVYFYQENRIEEYTDCLYCLLDPLSIVQKVLNVYEEEHKVFQGSQPVKRLYIYIQFLGAISRNYDLACVSFIKCLRKMEIDLCKPIESKLGCDYLQEDELRALEEDAVARFTHMLLEGDSVPGCYVPFLIEIVKAENLPVVLRVAATGSLGQYMLSSMQLAKDLKDIPEYLIQSDIGELKIVALRLMEKLVIRFPNDFLYLFTFIGACLDHGMLKETAYTVYVRLMAEDKFNVELFLTPISKGICEDDDNVRMLNSFMLKNFLNRSGRSKIKSVLQLYNHAAMKESPNKLVEVLVGAFLEKDDLQNDDLANSILQMLVKGKHEASFFASFLSPSYKVLNSLLSYLSSTPPKICLEGNSEMKLHLIRFVNNHKCHGPSSAERDLVEKLLNILGSKARKKRRGVSMEESALMSPEEYEAAVENFKKCQITNSLMELFTENI